jgi:CheY-like chemotaxis protein
MANKNYILIVDDEPMIVETLRMELSEVAEQGVPLITATSGDEALSIIHEEMEQGNYPAVAIVDYLMNPMKGSDLLITIEKISPDTQKIMLTGQADLSAVKQVLCSVRLYRYMEKPWQPIDMEMTISQSLRNYHEIKEIKGKNGSLEMKDEGVLILHRINDNRTEFNNSLAYARTIQQCFIPELNEDLVKTLDIHVMDRPLSQVSGDFRWYRQFGDVLYVAVGDCTGHGLAGAIIAVIATDILSNTLSNPASASQSTCKTVRSVMQQLKARLVRENGDANHVGMELTLARFDLKEKEMTWSSLNGFLVAVDTEGNTHILSKSRGISSMGSNGEDGCHFGSMNVAGHRVLMFTDGLTDQFGGALNKRLRLDGLLRMVEHGQVFRGQGECHIDQLFDDWRGIHDQVDDCLWMSLRIPE